MGFLAAVTTSGCGEGKSLPPPVISVSFPGGNSQTISLGQAVTIMASVSNDTSGRGVTWTLTGPGALSTQTTLSAEFVAPCGVTSNQIAMVTTTAVANAGASATFTVTVSPLPGLTNLSCDTFTNSTSQHATEVEPDTFAFGSTIVSTFQVGRYFTGASSDVGFATSTDGGVTWTNGLLPGITVFQGGTFDAVGDPSVAYDAAHVQWIIATIAVHQDASGNPQTAQILVSRSPDGLNWGSPIAVNPLAFYDKPWIVCDDTSTSLFYGHCYLQWRDRGLMVTSTSTDGGLTWPAPLKTADMINGLAGQPVVQPNGTVISPMVKLLFTHMLSFTSTDGGASWSATTVISPITVHTEDGNMRSGAIPSAEIDGAGTVYVVWSDCRFRTNCSSNDLILSTSNDGVTWTSPARIPIDPLTSIADYFLPGLAVDRATSGNTAHLTLTYYYYPVSACGTVCDLFVGYVSSQDGGQTWSTPVQLAGPMKTDWLANTSGGVMVGDYISTSYVNGQAFAVFAVAAANNGSVFDEAMYTTTQPLLMSANPLRFSSEGEMPVPNAKSDHEPRDIYPPRRPPLN
ncbi:MAG TPA: exo-alpha-sialidase [Candidatus Acidoferrum sp.]|nr:exo-alpha-sialidase [Candidatus Acidoferrum sp.]